MRVSCKHVELWREGITQAVMNKYSAIVNVTQDCEAMIDFKQVSCWNMLWQQVLWKIWMKSTVGMGINNNTTKKLPKPEEDIAQALIGKAYLPKL